MMSSILLVGTATSAFHAASPLHLAPTMAPRVAAPAMNGAFLALDAVEPAITSYVNIW